MNWRDHWRETEADDYTHDLTHNITAAAKDATEPRDVLAIAAASATAAESLAVALGADWALYTPQQAAQVASAILSQVESSAASLLELDAALQDVANRSDVEMPEISGMVARSEENLADALDRMRTAADELQEVVRDHAETLVNALAAVPCTLVLPGSIHETIHAVAGLLKGDVTVRVPHKPDDFDADSVGFGCGCSIDIVQSGEIYNFYRGDHEWVIVRESDEETLPDGSTVWSRSTKLEAHEHNAHPAQLAEEIRHLLEAEEAEDYHRVSAEYLARKARGETGPGIPHDEARRRVFGEDA